MRPVVIIGGLAVLGLGALALGSSAASAKPLDETIHGAPSSKRLTYRIPKPGEKSTAFRIGPGVVLLDGHEVQMYPATPYPDVNVARSIAREFQDQATARRATLPPDANRQNTDKYSKELYWAQSWLFLNPDVLTQHDLTSAVNGVPFDEFGRLVPGHYGNEGQDLWNQTLGGLLKNPLFKAVVVGALIASGPQGMAIYGAYTMWENRGKDLSLKNMALTAARAYAASQCGEPCAVAFDFGVGVASGKSYDKAAEDALMKELSPEQRAYYKSGKDSAHKMGLV